MIRILCFFAIAQKLLLPACSAQSISTIESELKTGKISVESVIQSEDYMHLHPETAFRNTIKQHAKQSTLKIINEREQGKRITVICKIVDSKEQPVKNALIYIYQTSAKGWYGLNEPHFFIDGGDHGHARLFGYLRTDAAGMITIKTIKPSGYPDSDLPAHIHIHGWDAGGNVLSCPAELLFEDDPRLTSERRLRALREGFIISENTGSKEEPLYHYKLSCK